MINQNEVSQVARRRLDNLYKTKTAETKDEQQEMVNFYSNLHDFPGCEERMDAAEFEKHREYFLAKLVEIKNSPLTSDKGKIRKDLENNGLSLSDLIQIYNKHNKTEKEIVEDICKRFLNGRGYKVQNWTLNSQEKSAFQDPIIDNYSSMKELEKIINELKEVDNEVSNGKNPFFHLKRLKECQNASSETDLGKAAQALNNNGNLLNNAINSLCRKSQEEKEKMLNSLSDWCFGMRHIYNIKDKKTLSYQNGEGDSWGYPGRFLLEKDFQEVKQAMINSIIKTIQKSPQEWKIVEICSFDADMHGCYNLGATKGYQQWDVMLIHQSAPLEYDEDGFLTDQPTKMYGEGLFTKKEFQQIKNILGVSTIEKIPFQKNGYQLASKGIKNKEDKGNGSKAGIIIAVTFLVGGVIASSFFIFFNLKRRKK